MEKSYALFPIAHTDGRGLCPFAPCLVKEIDYAPLPVANPGGRGYALLLLANLGGSGLFTCPPCGSYTSYVNRVIHNSLQFYNFGNYH